PARGVVRRGPRGTLAGVWHPAADAVSDQSRVGRRDGGAGASTERAAGQLAGVRRVVRTQPSALGPDGCRGAVVSGGGAAHGPGLAAGRAERWATGAGTRLGLAAAACGRRGGGGGPPRPASPPGVPLETLASQLARRRWRRYRLLEGRKGPIVADVVAVRALASRTGYREGLPGPQVWVLIRRPLPLPGQTKPPELKYYLSNASADTPLTELLRVCGMRWPIENCFEERKG